MPEEGFFRAGRTRPGPNVHGPRTGPTARRRVVAASALGHRRRHHRPRRGRPALARPAVRRPLRRPPGPAGPAVAGLAPGRRASSARPPCATCWTAGRTGAWSPATACSGYLWVAPTAKALRLVGLDVRAWSFVIPQLAHVHAVGVVRLALEPSIPAGGRWLSGAGAAPRGRQEPRPRRRRPAPRRPRPEAGAGLYGEDVDPLPKRVAVEVELTRKGAARLREAWTRPRHGRWTRTVYYAPPEVAGYLTGQLPASGLAIPSRSTRCPRCPGATYLRSRRCPMTAPRPP